MYSGLAEAYGLYTALSFFQQYCQYYPELLRNPRTIHGYCDNQGVIDRTSRTSPCSYRRDAISDDYPIYAELKHTIDSLQPITVMLHHVKGHQDTKSDRPLTLPEKLNIECDDRASRLEPHPDAVTFQNNPANDSAYPHLVIQKQIIIRRLQHNLRNASQTPDYYEYLRMKFSWPFEANQNVHWPSFQLALTRFKQTEHRFLTKYNHEWLPLQDRYHVKSLSIDQLCPSCKNEKETAQHFLSCPHPNRQLVWTELHHSIQKHSIRNNISSIICNLIEHGLHHGRQANSPLNPPTGLLAIQQMTHAQTQMGWKQMYYGRYNPL